MRKRKASGTARTVGSDALTQLALDLRWSWHHGADELWSQLDPELWRLTHNPWVVLQVASPARLGIEVMLKTQSADPEPHGDPRGV